MDYTRKYKTDHAYIMKWAKKMIAANSLGGKCIHCGNTDIHVLQFHHINPNDKEFHISASKTMHLDALLREVEKCELICGNCHSEKHQDERGNDVNMRRRKTKQALLEYKERFSCELCHHKGINHASLDFHHINPDDKLIKPIQDACIYGLTDKVCNELDKCSVICKNCHIKQHIKLDKFNELYEEIVKKVNEHIPRKKVNWDDVLRLIAEGNSKTKTAKILGCTFTAVHYILKKHSESIHKGDDHT